MLAADFVYNVINVNYVEVLQGNMNKASLKLAQAFEMVFIAEMTLSRVYLTFKAKEMSSFFKDVENQANPAAEPSQEGHASRQRTGFLLLVSFVLMTWESVSFTVVLHTTNLAAGDSWKAWLDGYPYAVAVFLLLWPSGMAHMVAFALVVTTVDRMLVVFDGLCVQAENLMYNSKAATTGFKLSYVTLNIESEPMKMTGTNQNVEMKSVIRNFRKLQSLFQCYDTLMGPLVLVMIVISTMILIDTTTNVLKPRDGANAGWSHVVYMAQRCIYLTVLDTGHRATNLVKCLFNPAELYFV